MFFSFDGIDGTGKSTQMDRFCGLLRDAGHEVVTCRDPGSTPLGERLREIILSHELKIDLTSEMLIYMAARAQLVSEVIRPALDRGAAVVSDRFLLANVAYQGYGGEMGPDPVWSVGELATGGCSPTLTFLLDLDATTAARRINRDPDRLEARGVEYFERVRQGFLTEAQRLGDRVAVIDASRPVEEVFEQVRSAAVPFLKGSVE